MSLFVVILSKLFVQFVILSNRWQKFALVVGLSWENISVKYAGSMMMRLRRNNFIVMIVESAGLVVVKTSFIVRNVDLATQ